jgi:toxin ParE1/3/4
MKIFWTEPAVTDLESLYRYIARDSEFYAQAIASEILQAVDRLEKFPLSGRMVPEMGDKRIREVLIKNYRVIYNLTKTKITILTIVHGARDLRGRS